MKKAAILGALVVTAAARAQYTSIDLSSYTNYLTSDQTAGGNYPNAGYAYSIEGIPFIASSYAASGQPNEGLVYLGPNSGLNSVTVAVNESGIQSIYTEINSAFGAPGTLAGVVTLNGSSGSTSYNLIEGLNIRDHYFGGFVNTIAPDIGGTVYWDNGTPTQVSPGNADPQWQGFVRNDMQGFVVPTGIGDLTSVTVTYANFDPSAGSPVFYGLTTSTDALQVTSGATPEPAPILALGLGALVVLRRRRR